MVIFAWRKGGRLSGTLRPFNHWAVNKERLWWRETGVPLDDLLAHLGMRPGAGDVRPFRTPAPSGPSSLGLPHRGRLRLGRCRGMGFRLDRAERDGTMAPKTASSGGSMVCAGGLPLGPDS